LHVRLDDASAAALEIVRAGELSDSEAVRMALGEAAARRRLRSAIRDEVRRLAADTRDREDMRIIREQLAELAPPATDWVVRGEVFRLPAPRGTRGHEQRGARYAVVVQADEFLGLSIVLISPTSASARAASFRPAVMLKGEETRVLVEQTTVVDPQRLGRSEGRLGAHELRAVDEALMLVLGL
jgi:mRNA interferase MazF